MNNEEKRRLTAIESLIEIEVDRERQGDNCIWNCEIMQKDIQELEKTAYGEVGPFGPLKTLELRKEIDQLFAKREKEIANQKVSMSRKKERGFEME